MQRISPAVRRTDQDVAHVLFDNRNHIAGILAGNASHQTDTFCTLVYTHPQTLSRMSRKNDKKVTSVAIVPHAECPE